MASAPAATVAPPAAAARPRTQAAGPRPLLLVDDSAVVRAKLRKLFEGQGYPVLMARDGLEALAVLETTACALMVTDLEMPNLDGIALITALAAMPQHEDMPILAITGHDDQQARLAALPGVMGVFRKPWVDEEFAARVQSLVAAVATPGG